ncbi:hypothetical protein [Alicyclobacillus kakegawensis]|uniref:hypothetical protein n=1 Tax=Alicyclobacillus kakegawensis TaxID=392012 RepID=UPI00082D6516|nr:hypothetical protein [Alicyclobacillus kakegawensis]
MTTGPFVDFLVALAALVLMLMTHKFIRSFLDHLIPFGSGPHGPGSLISGLMEGIGIGMGEKFLDAGKTAAKVTGGMGAAAGIAGLAGARKYLKENGLKKSLPALKKPDPPNGGGGGGVAGSNRTSGQWPGAKKAPFGLLPSPKEQGWTMTDPFTGEVYQGPGVNGFSHSPLDGESASAFGLGGDTSTAGDQADRAKMGDTPFGMAGMSGTSSTSSTSSETGMASKTGISGSNSSAKKTGASGAPLFDPASRANGAYTRMMPSSKEKLARLEGRPSYQNAMHAFFGEAGRRLGQDMRHKALGGRRGGYAGANNLLGVAMQEFGEGSAQAKIQHDMNLPSIELLKAAEIGGPESEAAQDLARIGQYQQGIEQGLQWISMGEQMQEKISPMYESAKEAYENAENEVSARAVELDLLRHANQEGTPQFVQHEAAYREAMARRDATKEQYQSIQAQMERAKNLSQRGEKRIIDSQNAIGKINWKYYKTPSQSMVRQAQMYANRVGLDDLSSPSGARGVRR